MHGNPEFILDSLSKVESELDKVNNILDDVIVKCHSDQLLQSLTRNQMTAQQFTDLIKQAGL